MAVNNTFIQITKRCIKEILRDKNIRTKHHDDICNGVKTIITDAMDDLIDQAIEQNRIIQGDESLKKYSNK